ncbi:MAG: DNA topoisomerase I [Bacteroidetes bacterium GWF2_38_335]|nr:MAG: DNA topoisomerase I [Bacteroidetes bacterium GWF2_38_335]OFY76998.1 MAG: DNA topoisomerase I [Bacteroidetes bacterium RIFOXYA12_FULL_38_20]HBS86855.1 type I DNA topoisomerase [Bacteroidales bacterium]
MEENLVIVESPAKAKTIEKFLGKNFVVKSSYGHIRDLVKKNYGIDIANNYQPQYEISEDKKKIVAELKKLAKDAKNVWLASDEDREGEAISWHLFEVLNLKDENTQRIVFHEITKEAIEKAIKEPRKINIDLVNAQQARRILDRLVGFELSPVLWKKVKPALSAGRVQSVAVRLIVDREREIKHFESTASFKVIALFTFSDSGKTYELKAELPENLKTISDANKFLESCMGADFKIENVVTKPGKKSPAPPFTTSTLQQEAARKLSFSVSQTMTVAQKLYESGKITYMRTDSVNLSDLAVNTSKSEIISEFGEKYLQTRKYVTKTKGAQEAHEAIRPTYINVHEIDGTSQEKRLYELIWKRTIASQMSDAQFEKTTATISISGTDKKLYATGEVMKFDGFLKVYLESTDEEDDETGSGILPPLNNKTALSLKNATATEKFTAHPARFGEASLVRKLEELGIGRPSTYAPTISTIQQREYVTKEDKQGIERKFRLLKLEKSKIEELVKTETTGSEKAKLFPTDIGMIVNDFLMEHFTTIMDFNFTATVEKEFDEIANGKMEWVKMIDKFYNPFHKTVEVTLKNSEKSKGERMLGKDPATGKPVYVKIGRYGAIAQIGDKDDNENDEKPRFASLRKNQSLETITLEEALDLFKLPRNLGQFEGKDITIGVGKFGPYVRHDNKFYSLKKGVDDPLTIIIDRAIAIIEEKREQEKQRVIKTFEQNIDLSVLNGRWGPYISFEKKNYKIPKKIKPAEITFEECMEIINQAKKESK